jgi:integrase/recombinase XerD
MQLGHDLNLTVRELKAWSQSLGHESVLTSLASYGALRVDEQSEVMATVTTRRDAPDAAIQALARHVAAEMARQATL